MKKLISLLIILSFLIVSFSCGPTTLPFPLNEENQWVFESDSGITTYKIVGSKENEEKGVHLFHMGRFKEGTMGKIDYYFQNEEGLFYYDTLKSKNPITALKYPLEEGTEWSYGKGENQVTFKIIGIEDVSVPAGDFTDCYKIEYKTKSGSVSMLEWFKPQIGFVKYEITQKVEVKPEIEEGAEEEEVSEEPEEEKEPVYETKTTTLELTSYTLH
jgi:hypothetical protein